MLSSSLTLGFLELNVVCFGPLSGLPKASLESSLFKGVRRAAQDQRTSGPPIGMVLSRAPVKVSS